MQIFCLQLGASCLQLTFPLTVVFGSCFAYNSSCFAYNSIFAYSGNTSLSTQMDCKQKNSTVSRKAPSVSTNASRIPKLSTLQHHNRKPLAIPASQVEIASSSENQKRLQSPSHPFPWQGVVAFFATDFLLHSGSERKFKDFVVGVKK